MDASIYPQFTDGSGRGAPAPIARGTLAAGKDWLTVAALLLLTATAFLPVGDFGPVNYDDDILIYGNPHVRTGLSLENVRWAFTSVDKLQWAPVTWLSHMLDFELFGNAPGAHHLTSVAFHLLNVALLFAFLRLATGARWRSAVVAALFAVHPLHVEPVAWLSARKDLVSTAWLLAALLAYLAYVRKPGAPRYLAALVAFALSLMAKPMFVTLPFVLVLLDHWPLARLDPSPGDPPRARARVLAARLVEKVPFLVLGLAFSVVGYVAQASSSAVNALAPGQVGERLAAVVGAYARYLRRTVWPSDLAVIYPREARPVAEVVILAAALVLVTAVALRQSRRRPWLTVGWLWFLVVLLPMIGIVQIGSAWMADKAMYVAATGLFVVVAWGVPDVLEGRLQEAVRRAALAGAAALSIALCFAVSVQSVARWRDSITLFTAAAAVTENNFVALGNLGAAYQAAGRIDDAMRAYEASVRAEPRYAIGHANLGNLWLMARSSCARAVPHLVKAIELDPGYGKARTGLRFCGVTPPGGR